MTLAELLGNAYKEGMSAEEIEDALKDRNLIEKDTFDKAAREISGYKKRIKELEDSGKTAETQLKTALEDAKAMRTEYSKAKNRFDVAKIFAKAGMAEEDYSGFIDGIISENEQESLDIAQKLADMVVTTRETAQKNAKTEIMKETPRPQGGVSNQDPEEKDLFLAGFTGEK